jgi:hypothetical protein
MEDRPKKSNRKTISQYAAALGWLFAAILLPASLGGQTVIGGDSPDSSSMLDVQSNSKGVLFPRLSTSQRNNIVNPAAGLMIFNTSSGGLEINLGSPSEPQWVRFMIQGEGALTTYMPNRLMNG